MKFLEIEVKFYITNIKIIMEQIRKIGAHSLGESFETNILYGNKNHNLAKLNNTIIRLRKSNIVGAKKTNKTIFTIKKPVKNQVSGFKVHHELEVSISDFNVMKHILCVLGYHKVKIYEKWRKTWKTGETLICLDTMPYGSFLEIEGEPEKIKSIAYDLKVKWRDRITASYLEIFEAIKEKELLNFTNLKFDNFKTRSSIFDKYRNLFEKG